jgi:hypothetical protein
VRGITCSGFSFLAGLYEVSVNFFRGLGGSEGLLWCVLLGAVSVPWLVHGNFVLGVHVDAQADSVSIKIVYGVEVLKESISDEEEILVLSWKSALVNDKVAFLMAGLIEVLFWVDFENVVTHLESNWLDLGSYILAALLHVTEGLVRGAIEVWQSLSPFLSDLLENIWWDGKLGGSSIDDSWV